MKSKGFTLVELLAVIVILAIISLIATPMVLGVIEKSKKSAAEASANGYIEAVNTYLISNLALNSVVIQNGIYTGDELDVQYKGKGPQNIQLTIEDDSIKKAKLCINDYSFDYDGNNVIYSDNNYCSNNYKISLLIDDQIEEKNINKETNTTFTLSNVTNKTNIVCNNGAIPTLENDTLTIDNIFGDTTCKVNNTLEDTINNLDNTKTNILMINDEEVSNTITIGKNKNVTLDLNGKNIEFTILDKLAFDNKGYIVFNDSTGKGTIKSEYRTIENHNVLIINDGNYISNTNIVVYNTTNKESSINGGTFISEQNTAIVNTSDNILNISNSKIYAIKNSSNLYQWRYGIVNYNAGTINIYGDVLIENKGTKDYSNCGVHNDGTGIIKISGLPATFDENGNYMSGIYIYTLAGAGIRNDSTVIVNGATINSYANGITNTGDNSKSYINSSYIKSNTSSVRNEKEGQSYICNSKLDSLTYELYNESIGTINYSRDVIFTNGTNTPNKYNPSGTINANYTGTCLSD